MVPCPRHSANASVWSPGMCAVVTTQPASRIAAASSASGEPVKLGPTCPAAWGEGEGVGRGCGGGVRWAAGLGPTSSADWWG